MAKTSNNAVISLLKEKASKSYCTYKISAIAFDKKGDILGHVTNKHSDWDVLAKEKGQGRSGTAKHAERLLMQRYKGLIKTILICRVGHSGEIRPIDPCPACKKVADKLGISIISVQPGTK
jgi:rubrerythrin